MPPQQEAPAPLAQMSAKPPKMNLYLAIGLVVLFVLLLAGGGAYYMQMNGMQLPPGTEQMPMQYAPQTQTPDASQNVGAAPPVDTVNPVDEANPFNDTDNGASVDTNTNVNAGASAGTDTSDDYQNPFQ